MLYINRLLNNYTALVDKKTSPKSSKKPKEADRLEIIFELSSPFSNRKKFNK